MNQHLRLASVGVASCLLVATALGAAASQKDKDAKDKDQEKRPKLSLSARPPIGISPARIVLSAELVGGANDLEDFYCPLVEWEWGDGTTSEVGTDCDPYEAGKSMMKRRYTTTHIFRAGHFRVAFRLKKQGKTIVSAVTPIEVRPGIQDLNEQ